MSRIRTYLQSLKDFELAFLSKYKLHTYMKGTRNKITQEIEERNLSNSDRDALIKSVEFNPNNEGCPRCNSSKIRTDKVDATNSYGSSGYSIAYAGAAMGSGEDLSSKGQRIICEIPLAA
jgi:hypothetical protein